VSTEMNVAAAGLAERFDAKDVLSFEGRGGRTFDYIEDETVMDRADEVLGLGATSWSFTVVTDACVRGSLDVRWPDGTASHYEDFGYATRADSAEPLKEAVSDAIRRLGRYIGIARYLYHKHDSPRSTGRGTPPQPRPAAPKPDVVPDEPPDLFPPIEPAHPGETCDEHGVPWAGEVGDLWHGPKPYHRHPGNTRKGR